MATIASSLTEIKTTLAQLLASTQTFSLDSLDQLRKKDPDRADGLLATHIGGISEDRQKKIFKLAESLRVNREKAEKEKKEEEKKKKETERKETERKAEEKKETEREETERKRTERKEAKTKGTEMKDRVSCTRDDFSLESFDFEDPFPDLDWPYGPTDDPRRRRQRQLYDPRYYEGERQGYGWCGRLFDF
jgi:flagellar biosynthesis GTPase FlhF